MPNLRSDVMNTTPIWLSVWFFPFFLIQKQDKTSISSQHRAVNCPNGRFLNLFLSKPKSLEKFHGQSSSYPNKKGNKVTSILIFSHSFLFLLLTTSSLSLSDVEKQRQSHRDPNSEQKKLPENKDPTKVTKITFVFKNSLEFGRRVKNNFLSSRFYSTKRFKKKKPPSSSSELKPKRGIFVPHLGPQCVCVCVCVCVRKTKKKRKKAFAFLIRILSTSKKRNKSLAPVSKAKKQN